MEKRQSMTDEELDAVLEEIWGPLPPRPKPKPKVVTSDGKGVRDCDVQVSPKDPNYPGSDGGRVQRGFVKINMELWEEQQRQRMEDRRHRREIDPARTGIWDDPDED